jgi:hypothetical protein
MPGGITEAGEVNKQQTGGPKMKKFMMVIALLTLSALVSSSFADVQNIRLSGDVRIRGYYNTYGGQLPQTSLIAQRTRITCEADLEDHVLVVVTLMAEGIWGDRGYTHRSAGAGLPTWGEPVNRMWDVGMPEAYVQLNEMFFQAATLKLGRQYLHYGRGMIISSVENEYNFDAARLVLDYYPLTVDLVAALINDNGDNTNGGQFFPIGDNSPTERSWLLFANARYEMTDSFIKAVEGYFGWVTQSKDNHAARAETGYAPMIMGASPWIVGLRGDLNLTKNLQAWIEGAYEGGADGFASSKNLSAFLVNAGAQLSLGDSKMAPAIHANYTFASGGGSVGQNTFRPWFDLANDYNGYLFKPLLSNMHIFNVGASIKPAKNCTAGVDVYYYMKSAKNMSVEQNPNIDLGYGRTSLGATGAGSLGWEVDGKLGYDYSKDVRFGLIAGVFIPGKSLEAYTDDKISIGVRGEVAVKF